ncbi:FG-GAP repeat domain-containing protein [Streptomyces indicus]|uniref:Repeat domain-containing protein n=1 Tax=Streptomyces indicus TaxID=417292 RepID=A0A1G9DG28_9ACTN|nr:VCBS repeat-containing protein [Streptomyces indicus]SDK62803.1 Repeat domain-containing protein [Streptomyces indicus]
MVLSTAAQADERRPGTAAELPAPAYEAPAVKAPQKKSPNRLRAAAAPVTPRADLDGDGFSEIVHRAWDDRTYTLNPTTGELLPYTVGGSGLAKDILAPGDLDGTADVEFLTLSQTGTLSLFRHNDASGTTTSPAWSGKGWQIYNKVFAPADVTGDGKPDLLARTPAGDLYVYAGTGNASSPFASRVRVGGGWQAYDQLVGVGDMDGDGLGDIVARDWGGSLYFYGGAGSTSAPLDAPVRIGGGWNTYNQLAAVDDGDGDGLADIIARTHAGQMYFYSSNGAGGFHARTEPNDGWHPITLFVGGGALPHVGKSELFGLDTKGTLYGYAVENNGKLGTRGQVSDTGGWAGVSPANIALASSLDADGHGDWLEVYAGKLYRHGAVLSSSFSGHDLFLGPGDLSGDGKGDLLARSKTGYLYLYRGNGLGTSLASRITIGGGWNAYDRIVGGDFSGDGIADIVARTPAGALYLYKGTGNSAKAFGSRIQVGKGWQQFTKLASPGDIDGDGRSDLIATNSAGEAFRYSSYDYGKFKPMVKLGNGWNTYRGLY